MKSLSWSAKEQEPEPEPHSAQHFGRGAIRDDPDDIHIEPVGVGEFHVGDSNEDSDSDPEVDVAPGTKARSNSPSTSVPLPQLPQLTSQDVETDTASDDEAVETGEPPIPAVSPRTPRPTMAAVLPPEQVSTLRALIEEAEADYAAGDYTGGDAALAHAEELERIAGKLRGGSSVPQLPDWASSPTTASSVRSSGKLLPDEQVDEIRSLIALAERDLSDGDTADAELAIAHAEQLERMAGVLRGPSRPEGDQWHEKVQKHVKGIQALHSERPSSMKMTSVAKRRWECSIEAHVEAIHALHLQRKLAQKRWRAAIESHVEAIQEVRSHRGTGADKVYRRDDRPEAASRDDLPEAANPMLLLILVVLLVIVVVHAVTVNSQLTEIQEQLQCAGNDTAASAARAGG